jgi:hypothetical protein
MNSKTGPIRLIFYLLISLLGFGCLAQTQPDFEKTEKIKINPIPKTAKIIYHQNNFIYAMDENGGGVTQITFDNSRTLEHVAISYDRTKIVANYWHTGNFNPSASKILLFDIKKQTLSHLLPKFHMAGNGGVDWDKNGFIYFAGVSKLPFPKPNSVREHQANAGANDIYRVRVDGTGLKNLTNSKDRGEADVSVSQDNESITYMGTNINDPHNSFTEIWKRNADGSNPKLVFKGGKDRVSSVHDPELSPDGQFIVFSRVNKNVAPVFPNDPLANTAHDILRINIENPERIFVVTKPGSISIAPDWFQERILFLEINDKTKPPFSGLATIKPDGTDYNLIREGANIGKWIP